MIHASLWAFGVGALASFSAASCLSHEQFFDSAPCTTNEECDDGDPCKVAICQARSCQYSRPTCGLGDPVCQGEGRCAPCTTNEECGESTSCSSSVCVSGACQVQAFSATTPLIDRAPGDCLHPECDGTGHEVRVPEPLGTACLGGVCDSEGHCVECLSDASCATPKPRCFTEHHTCVECVADADCSAGSYCDAAKNACASCTDGAQSGDETGVDCGGAHCTVKCTGEPCTEYTDCKSQICNAGICS